MTMKISSIVEGEGEVAALPILLRRISEWMTPGIYPEILKPIRVRRDRFLGKEIEFHRFMTLASHKCDGDGWILVLLDADDDCPAQLGHSIIKKSSDIMHKTPVSAVIANREYEAWFIASAPSLHQIRGFNWDPEDSHDDAERPRDAKGWIERRMKGSYGEVRDQAAFTHGIDLQMAHDRSRSFRKLCSEWRRQSAALGRGPWP